MTSQELLPTQELTDQAQENTNTLEGRGELGLAFASLYRAAITEEPELAEILIVAVGSDVPGYGYLEHTGGTARHKGGSQSGQHEVVINTDDGTRHYQKLLETRKTTAEICATKAGIDAREMTPEQFASFIFLHELGHVVDYEKNAPGINTRDERRKRDMATLPMPNFSPPRLAEFLESAEGNSWFSDSLPHLKDLGFSTKGELMVTQEKAYHALETEDIPDQFAISVMKKQGII